MNAPYFPRGDTGIAGASNKEEGTDVLWSFIELFPMGLTEVMMIGRLYWVRIGL